MVRNVEHGDAVIVRSQEYLARSYKRSGVVGEAVRKSGLAKRSFDRRFRAATGHSPLEYVQALRIEEAKELLETTSTAAEKVGRKVGYEDAASFRRLFARIAGMTPGDYRRKFQLPAFVRDLESPRPVVAKRTDAGRSSGARRVGP